MLTRSIVRRAVIGAGLVVLAACGSAQAQETLKYKWNKGDVLHYRSQQDTSAKMSAMGMTQVTTMQQDWVQRFEVKEVAPDGVATLDMTVVSVKITQEQGTAGKGSFDSTKPAEQQFEGMARFKGQMEAMGAMVGEHVNVTIDSAGNVRKVEGMAKILDKMLAKLGTTNQIAARGMRATMGDEAMRGNIERYFKVLPEKPVKTGDTWNNTFEQVLPAAGGRLKVDSTWTLGGSESLQDASVVKLTGPMKIEVIPPKEGEDTGLAPQLKTTLNDAKGDGEVYFDATVGQLVKSIVNMTLPIEGTMSGQQGGQSVSIKTDTTMKFTFERVPAPEKSADTTKPAPAGS